MTVEIEMDAPPDRPAPAEAAGPDEPSGAEVSTRRIEVGHVCLVAVASLAGLLLSRAFALGGFAGGLLMIANFRVIGGVIRSVFLKETNRIGNVIFYWLKFVGVLGLVGVIVVKFRVDALGFLVGLSLILVAITAEAVVRLIGK